MFYTVYPNDGTSEKQYLELIRYVMEHGHARHDRTGVGTYAVHGAMMRFDLSDGSIPLLTTKRIPWKAVVHELNWFLSGETNILPLLKNNVHIWSEWPHAKYVKSTGDNISMAEFELRMLRDGAFAKQWGGIGPGYGHQWRAWQGPDGKVYDQVSDVIHLIKNAPHSRRILFHGWNVADLDKMALPPCHLLYQFFVADGKLSLTMYQRSCDVGLGLPFNIASCAFLVRMMAQQCGLEPGQLVWFGHDVHVYSNHIDPLKEQLDRTPRSFPKLELVGHPLSLFDYSIDDFNVMDYKPDPSIKMEVAV